jgi:predicted esterase
VSRALPRSLATIGILAATSPMGACAGDDDPPACTTELEPGAACGTSGVFDRSMCVEGRWRRFREYVPATLGCAAPAPVIVFLHGLGGDQTSGDAARPVADEVGAILVSPVGVDQGGGLGFGPEEIPNSRALVAMILDALAREFPTDPKFTVLTGFSNGGVLASYGIAWYNERLAAVGVFASGVAEDITTDLRAANEKIPVVVRIGDTDTFHQPFASRLKANLLDAGWPPARVDSQRFAGGHTWTPDMVRETFAMAKSPPP